MLSYNDYPAVTYTSLVVVNLKTRKQVEGVDIASQSFRGITQEIIDVLIKEGDVMFCAGGFLIDSGIFPVVDVNTLPVL